MKIARVCDIYCRKRWMKILFMRPDIPKKRVKFVTCAFDTLRGWAAKLEEVVYEKTWGKVMCIWKSALHVLEEAAIENMGGKVIFKTTLWMHCMNWRKRLLKQRVKNGGESHVHLKGYAQNWMKRLLKIRGGKSCAFQSHTVWIGGSLLKKREEKSYMGNSTPKRGEKSVSYTHLTLPTTPYV